MSPSRRAPAVIAILALLAAGGVIDRRHRAAPRSSARLTVPMAAAPGAGSSAWYCTGATAGGTGNADGNVVIANAGRRALAGAVTVYPNQGEPRRQPVTVAARGRQVVRLADVASSQYASALVELDGGEAVVELAASGPLGDTATPCSSAASSQWYFASGVTTKDATETLFLFNPFPDDAVVDLVFGTEDGQVTPQALTGLAVKGGGMNAVNVGDFVQRREQVTTSVRARAGRLVASRLQSFDGTASRKGMALALGTAAPGDVWYLPDGLVADGVSERYQVYNPSTREAQVELSLSLDQGEAEPLVLTVPAQSRVTVSGNDETRVPRGVAHAVIARALNDVGVVVEQEMDFAAAAKRTGVAITPGSQVTARRWALASGAADEAYEEYVVVQNPGTATARASITVLGDSPASVDALQGIEVGPGQRRAVRLNDALRPGPSPLVVGADQPVVVERVLNRLKSPGVATTIGISLRDS